MSIRQHFDCIEISQIIAVHHTLVTGSSEVGVEECIFVILGSIEDVKDVFFYEVVSGHEVTDKEQNDS